MLRYYVYRHIRKDKNEPFYIGIGTKRKTNWLCYTSEFERAFSKRNRNPMWNSIAKKTDYTVEIIFETSDYEIAKLKEVEFISLYRKKVDGGTLSNFTNGGDGTNGVKRTQSEKDHLSKINKGKTISTETREKLRIINLGKKHTPETIEKMKQRKGIPLTDAQKLHLSKINKGRKHTEATLEKLKLMDISHLYTEEGIRKSAEGRRGKYSGDKCWNSKLTSTIVFDIKYNFIPLLSDIEIGKLYGVSSRTINKIRKNETWKDV